MNDETGRLSTVGTIGRGLDEAPILRQGLGVTWLIATKPRVTFRKPLSP